MLTKVVDRPASAQDIHDAAGGVPLGDAVQRDRGAMPEQPHMLFADAQAAAAHFRQRLGEIVGQVFAGRFVRLGCEVARHLPDNRAIERRRPGMRHGQLSGRHAGEQSERKSSEEIPLVHEESRDY